LLTCARGPNLSNEPESYDTAAFRSARWITRDELMYVRPGRQDSPLRKSAYVRGFTSSRALHRWFVSLPVSTQYPALYSVPFPSKLGLAFVRPPILQLRRINLPKNPLLERQQFDFRQLRSKGSSLRGWLQIDDSRVTAKIEDVFSGCRGSGHGDLFA